jgi:hypothetical protein
MNRNILEILAHKRERIALLHGKLETWLSHYDRLYQKAEDFLNEKTRILSTENELMEDTKKLFAELENDNTSLNHLIEIEVIDAHKIKSEDLPINDYQKNDENQDNHSKLNKADSVLTESAQTSFNKKSNEILQLTADTSSSLLLDLEGLALPQAIFKYLDSVFPEPQLIKTICHQLLQNGFRSDSIQFYEQVRSVLRLNQKKGVLEKVGVEWKVTDEFHGKEFLYSPRKLKTSKVDETEIKNIAEISENQSEKQNLSVQSDILPPQNSQSQDGATEANKTLTEYYREVIEQSGQPWLHIDQILVLLKNNYNIVRKKSNVASVLRQGAKNNRTFKSFGRNRFGLIEGSIQKKNATV